MMRNDELMRRILSGRSDANVRFDDLRRLLSRLGFIERIREVITFSRSQEFPK